MNAGVLHIHCYYKLEGERLTPLLLFVLTCSKFLFLHRDTFRHPRFWDIIKFEARKTAG
jgi:hypothetical protein